MSKSTKNKSGLLYQKVLKKAPIYEPMRIREVPKRIAPAIELPSFQSAPRYKELKPMDPQILPEHQEMIRQKNEALENLHRQKVDQMSNFEMPEFKPLKGKAKRQFKRENIQRVADKYDITRGQARRGLRKMRRAGEDYIPEEYLSSLKMVQRNSAVPFKLPHQSNAALHSNHHDFDPRNKEIYENMSQDVKDSLHSEANKYGKPFWSDQHQVNVDPEDGVLSNRPRDAKGEYFKFETINKPYSNAAPQQTVSSSGGDGDSELIKVDGKVVLGANRQPISQEDFDYYQKQNELYPEYVYDSSSTPGFRDEAELNPDYPNAVIPKSTSIRHTQELMKNPDIRFYNRAVDSLMKMPGYERLKPIPRNR